MESTAKKPSKRHPQSGLLTDDERQEILNRIPLYLYEKFVSIVELLSEQENANMSEETPSTPPSETPPVTPKAASVYPPSCVYATHADELSDPVMNFRKAFAVVGALIADGFIDVDFEQCSPGNHWSDLFRLAVMDVSAALNITAQC